MIDLFTDGSARGNPGPGGYGAILKSGVHYKEISGGFVCTTNNRMELLAVIKGLEAVKKPNSNITVWSDSKYVCDSVIKGWLFDWEKKGFLKRKNSDLWRRFLEVYRRHNVKFIWIKGHSGHPENERCDKLAVEASSLPTLDIDEGFIAESDECTLDSSTTDQTLHLL